MLITGGCFGGANGEKGFVNYFDCIFRNSSRLYIINGGCGCGKSSFMKAVAAEAENKGETVERVYCASDPGSLDGIVLKERGVGLLDGTSPHEHNAKYTGAVDTLIDLGEYLNTKKLNERTDEIIALTDSKKDCYTRAYGLLAAAGEIRKQIASLTNEAVLWDKMKAAAERMAAKHVQKNDSPHIKLRARTAFCSKGLVTAKDYGCTQMYTLSDSYDIAQHFYRALFAACVRRQIPITVSPDALSPYKLEALRIDNAGVLLCDKPSDSVVNMERFVDKQLLRQTRSKRKLLEKAKAVLTEEARATLAEASVYHRRLEDIYIPAMNFSKVDKRRTAIIKQIFS